MRVYLIRHGIAVPRGSPGIIDDAARELTADGAKKTRRAVRGLVRLGVDLQRIWSSPLVRARQTAEILAEAFPDAGAVRSLRALAPEGDFDRILAALSKSESLKEAALVGHEPDLGELASLLLTGRRVPFLEFRKGGVACIDLESSEQPGRGRLEWLLTPRQLRLLARS